MISFNEWMNEIAISGGIDFADKPSLRRPSKLAPDAAAGRIFRVSFGPSTLSMLRSFGTDSRGLPGRVQEVLDSMVGGAAMMSNEDAEAFRRVAQQMKSGGGMMAMAGADIERAIDEAVSEAVK